MKQKVLIKIPFKQHLISRTGFTVVDDSISIKPALRIRLAGNEILINTTLDVGLAAVPQELDFGEADTASVLEKDLAIYNPGNVPLSLTRVEIVNDRFSISPDIALPIALRPGQRTSIKLRFSPVDSGEQVGMLAFFSGDLEHPAVRLRGNVAGEAVRLSPPSIDFGKIKTGPVVSYPMRIWNQSSVPLKISQAAVSNARFSAVAATPLVIDLGKSGSAEVRFAATDESAQQGTLTLGVGGSAETPLVVPLFGAARKAFPDQGIGKIQARQGRALVKDAANQLTENTRTLSETNIPGLMQQLANCISKDDPFSSISLGQVKFAPFVGDRLNSLAQGLTLAPEASTSSQSPPFRFDLSVYQGLYAWQSSISQFAHSNGESGIRILFPGPGSAENDAELKILEYEEGTFTQTAAPSRQFYRPVRVLASLHEKRKQVALLDLSFQYNANGTALKASGELWIPPFSLSVALDNSPGNAALVNALLHKSSRPIASAALRVGYPEGVRGMDAITTIEGDLKVSAIEANGAFDGVLSRTPGADLNKILRLVILGAANGKIADLTVIKEWSEERQATTDVLYFLYEDGTKEKVEVILGSWAEALKNFSGNAAP